VSRDTVAKVRQHSQKRPSGESLIVHEQSSFTDN
jgi:hypothetical protein